MGGLVEEALEVSLAGVEAVRRYGSELSFGIFLELNAVGMLIELGRYREAAERLALLEAADVLPGVSTIFLHGTLARLAAHTGDLAAARKHLQIARSEATGLSDAQFVADLHATATEIALWDGDPAAALLEARTGFERLEDTDDAIVVGQLALPAVRAAADLAVTARAGRDGRGADAAVAAAREMFEHYRGSTARLTERDALADHELGWRMALCEAELARATGEDAPTAWEALRPALSGRPAPYLEAYALWREAEAHLEHGTLEAAAAPLREAHAIAAGIGAGLLVATLEALARRRRLDLAPRPTRQPAPVPADADDEPVADDPFGLTSREREVLALVAEGYTNKRIADTLFISPSTAGVHVSNILGKLGAATRTEAATMAVRLGLDRVATS
jgi:DNA-binding CsgD family transcriptional regulator